MDKSLDEIVAATKKARIQKRGTARRSSARAQVLGNRPATATSAVARTRGAAAAAAPVDGVKAITQNSEKIIVSNLPPDVNEENIRDFFTQTVGAVQSLSLSYDAQGRSKGVATVTFSKKGDAQKAFKEYNNRLIDRKRPMKIEIVVDPSKPAPLTARVTPASASAPAAAAPAAKTNATRGAGRRRGRGGARKGDRPQKSAADLDAEMEDYTASTAAPAAATA